MKRIYGLLESCILAMMGAGMLWFSLSDRYGLLMNVKFRPLTVSGAVLVLLLRASVLLARCVALSVSCCCAGACWCWLRACGLLSVAVPCAARRILVAAIDGHDRREAVHLVESEGEL